MTSLTPQQDLWLKRGHALGAFLKTFCESLKHASASGAITLAFRKPPRKRA